MFDAYKFPEHASGISACSVADVVVWGEELKAYSIQSLNLSSNFLHWFTDQQWLFFCRALTNSFLRQ